MMTTKARDLLSGFSRVDGKMARPEGLKPPTSWVETTLSVQLIYGRIKKSHVIPTIIAYSRQQELSLVRSE